MSIHPLTLIYKATPALLGALVLTASLCAPTFAEENYYYRWMDSDGVVHYGSRPPAGVDAVRIKAHGGGSTAAQKTSDSKAPEKTPQAEMDKRMQDAIAQREQQCKDEKERLATLKTAGARVRMKQPDGSVKYLTPEEIAQEISSAEEFVSQGCK